MLGKWIRQTSLMGVLVFAVLFALVTPALAASAPPLGTAQSFAVLGGTTVTNTGPTIVNGNLGVSPGSAVTGFPPGIVTGGTIHAADAVAGQAQSDTTTTYNNLAGQACDHDLTGQDLGGKTLVAGVYCFTSSAQLTGALTLDAQGSANAVFIFQIVSTLTTASGSSVNMINGGSPCNVFWKVGSSATVGTTTQFLGTIVALTSIALQTGANVTGRALARIGAVTMDTNNVSASGCESGGSGGGPDTTPPTCALTAVIAGPPKRIQITVQDTGSGLATVVVTTSTNATTVVPPFTPGTTSPVVVTATKINQSQGSTVALKVTDVSGNVTNCDPVDLTLTRDLGKPDTTITRHVAQGENQVTIQNNTPGVTKLVLDVNGSKFVVAGLKDGESRTINIASAMRSGIYNTIKTTALGTPGGSVTIVFWGS